MFSKRVITVACTLVVCLALAGQAQDPNEATAPYPSDGAQYIQTEGLVLTWTIGEVIKRETARLYGAG